MLLSAVSVLVVAQSSSEIPEGLMNNPVLEGRMTLYIEFSSIYEYKMGRRDNGQTVLILVMILRHRGAVHCDLYM